nr:MAG TPA: hypothetical protein [Caudoviricetes sp.]
MQNEQCWQIEIISFFCLLFGTNITRIVFIILSPPYIYSLFYLFVFDLEDFSYVRT